MSGGEGEGRTERESDVYIFTHVTGLDGYIIEGVKMFSVPLY